MAAHKHWTDEQKQTLIAEFDAIPAGSGERKAYIKKLGISDVAFYSMRKRFRQDHAEPEPEPQPKEKRISEEGLAKIAAAQKKRWAAQKAAGIPHRRKSSFRDATPEVKRQMLAEYDALPAGEPRRQWRAKHGLKERGEDRGTDSAYMTYWRRQLEKKSVALVPHTNGNKPLSQIPVAHLLPQAAPAPVVTLDDAINALQVRQDIFNEFLNLLRSMQRGGVR